MKKNCLVSILSLCLITLASFSAATLYSKNAITQKITEYAPIETSDALASSSIAEVAQPIARLVNILIVAGHEPTFGGAEYRTLKERDMTLEVARYLGEFLKQNPMFSITTVRNEYGWNPVFSNYFVTHATATKEFYESHRAQMAQRVASGEVTTVSGVPHNSAPEAVAMHLYGISKWANEHAVDLVVHIHFNDYPRKNANLPGKYAGLTVYVPERQYDNSSSSMAIAQRVFPYLMKIASTSTLPTESAGIVEDQELIALGKYDTLKVPSILIEYGYIYEPQFQDAKTAQEMYKKLALQTYRGIEAYFR